MHGKLLIKILKCIFYSQPKISESDARVYIHTKFMCGDELIKSRNSREKYTWRILNSYTLRRKWATVINMLFKFQLKCNELINW